MPFVTSDDIRAEQAEAAWRVHRLQAALDHAHAIETLLHPEQEHQARAYLAKLRGSLTASRDATAKRIRVNEGLLTRVLAEEAAAVS